MYYNQYFYNSMNVILLYDTCDYIGLHYCPVTSSPVHGH